MQSVAYASFVSEVDDLHAYLSTANLMRAVLANAPSLSEPSLLERELEIAKAIAPEPVRWRVMEHTLTVSRLYALYESFCEETLRDWISFVSSNLKFAELPNEIRENYPSGFAYLIGVLPSPRYPNLTVEDLVNRYHAALQGGGKYRLSPECLIHHKNNLRWKEVCEIFARCGIAGLDGWVIKNTEIFNYFLVDKNRIVSQLSSKLSGFIQYRNDCSHGIVGAEEILGHEELRDLTEFILKLTSAIDQIVHWKKIEVLLAKGRAVDVGRVTEVLKKANAFICRVDTGHLFVGQRLFFQRDGNLSSQLIMSLQINGMSTPSIDAEIGMEVGIRCEVMPSVGSRLYVDNRES